MSSVNPKNQAKVIQSRMRELGYPDFKLGHAQELVATLAGVKSWNVLSSKIKDENSVAVSSEGSGKKYTIRVESSVLCKMYLEVDAQSLQEAYLKTRSLLEDGSDNDQGESLFNGNLTNWEPIYRDSGDPVITEISGEGEFSGHHEEGIPLSYFEKKYE